MPVDDLQQRVQSLRWYHSIDLGGGLVTPGVDKTSERLRAIGLPETLKGKTVLDVGAWDGFFSFEVERRGASRVVASDYYAWRGPGWGTDNGKAPFELARAALQSSVEDIEIDVSEIRPERLGMFDVVLFLGVLYHLPNPMMGLERVASVTRELLIVETVVDLVGVRRPAAAFYPDRELSNDPTNWWGPNHAAVSGMLRSVGFAKVAVVNPIPSAPYRFSRAIWHRVQGKSSFGASYHQDRAAFHAFK